jgi:hypothetical protein
MVDKSRRKELLQQYAERPPQDGVFAVRNIVTGEAWVGVSRNLDVQKNSLWMRFASDRINNPEADASWKAYGAAAFNYEVLERFSDTDRHVIERLRLERQQSWSDRLKAGILRGT